MYQVDGCLVLPLSLPSIVGMRLSFTVWNIAVHSSVLLNLLQFRSKVTVASKIAL